MRLRAAWVGATSKRFAAIDRAGNDRDPFIDRLYLFGFDAS